MSRVGNKKISIPQEMTVEIVGREVKISGPKGEQSFAMPAGITAEAKEGKIKVSRAGDSKSLRSLHGTSARIIENMTLGLSQGFIKKLEYKGVGFTAGVADSKISMRLGYSHPVILPIPKSLNVSVVKNTIIVEGTDKSEVGAFAAKIRETRKPEVYKGKGIKYQGEFIKKKAGKAAQTTTGA